MINLLLVIVARLLFMLLSPFNFLYVLFIKEGFSWERLSGYFHDEAVAIDRFGNFQYRGLLNKLFIKDKGYKHGNFNETISSVLGKNEEGRTLTRVGKWLV